MGLKTTRPELAHDVIEPKMDLSNSADNFAKSTTVVSVTTLMCGGKAVLHKIYMYIYYILK